MTTTVPHQARQVPSPYAVDPVSTPLTRARLELTGAELATAEYWIGQCITTLQRELQAAAGWGDSPEARLEVDTLRHAITRLGGVA